MAFTLVSGDSVLFEFCAVKIVIMLSTPTLCLTMHSNNVNADSVSSVHTRINNLNNACHA